MTPPLREAGGDDRAAAEIAFPALYERYLPRTLRWLRQFGVAARHREDVAQDAWIRVMRTLERYESSRPFEPWLMTITYRAACDHHRRADIRSERLTDSGEVEPPTTPATEDFVIDAARTLDRVLAQLSEDHRIVLLMVDGEEMDAADVAEALGIPLNTVYSRLSRARSQFQNALGRLRAAEQARLGAAVVLPAFLLDLRALFDAGRDLPPVSVGTASRIWDGVQHGLDALDHDGGTDGDGNGTSDPHGGDDAGAPAAPPRAPRPSVTPPATSTPARLGGLARWFGSPVGLAATIALSGLGGGAVAAWWMRGHEAGPPAIASEQDARSAPAISISSSATSDLGATLPPRATASSTANATANTYDPREELSTLEAAYALYAAGKCSDARAKLGNRKGHVHASDYSELRKKIDACIAKNGAKP
ncbi:MAG: sigma-70 family RNA polymerase sigma factor [Polyangiaceae bacterium]